MAFPPEFVAKAERMFGDRARAWLPRLPELLARCRARWSLAEGAAAPLLSMNYVELTATRDGRPVALKVGVPHADLFTEMESLALFGGRGAVRFLDADRPLGAILMERVQPGTMLWQHGDDLEQTRIAAGAMRRLAMPVPPRHGLPRVADQVARAFHQTRTTLDPGQRLPRDLLAAAEGALRQVEGRDPEPAVLHGDLHQENLLFDGRAGWLAIDPKGVVGPRCLEVGRYLGNRIAAGLPPGGVAAVLGERLEVFAEVLGYPTDLLAAAGLVDLVLGHCWALEDGALGDDWDDGLRLARLLMERM